MTEIKLQEARQLIASVGRLMLERNLTDLAGGNISMRIGNKIVMSPSYAGTGKFWQLDAEDVLVLNLQGKLLKGNGKVSRESPVHLMLLNSFYPSGCAVIHAHARNVMVFCAAKQAILPVLENTYQFGEIRIIKYARGGIQSQQLAENICAGLKNQKKRIARSAAAVIAPWHGLFAIGKDMHTTLEAVERIEINARCILLGSLLPGGTENMEKQRRELDKLLKYESGWE